MEMKKLGNSSLETAPIILGGNVFGWTIDEQRSFEILDAFIQNGFNAIDTADVYSAWAPSNKGGESETIIGKWMKKNGNRTNIIVATKTGADRGHGPDLTYKHIIAAAEESLKRLQTDYIDLYQSHFDNGTTPVEETLKAYDQLVRQGKVKFIGTSNMSPERIEHSLRASKEKDLPRYETLQPLYNLYDREKFETTYRQLCLDHRIGVIPYYSLASGFLTGKYRSENDLGKSKRGASIKKYLNTRGMRILAALDKVSNNLNATQGQVAIAWLIAQPTIVAGIASATSIEQVDDFKKAIDLNLSKDDIMQLTAGSEYF